MTAPEVHTQIRRLFYAEHWRVNTIAAQLCVHHDTVRRALEPAHTRASAIQKSRSVVRSFGRFPLC
jgi:DNA-binding transcriptional regulator LsrR (DeoR family)